MSTQGEHVLDQDITPGHCVPFRDVSWRLPSHRRIKPLKLPLWSWQGRWHNAQDRLSPGTSCSLTAFSAQGLQSHGEGLAQAAGLQSPLTTSSLWHQDPAMLTCLPSPAAPLCQCHENNSLLLLEALGASPCCRAQGLQDLSPGVAPPHPWLDWVESSPGITELRCILAEAHGPALGWSCCFHCPLPISAAFEGLDP